MKASALATQLDPTQARSWIDRTFSIADKIRSHLMSLYTSVTHTLTSIEFRRWLDACAHTFLHTDWIWLAVSSPIFLLLVPMGLSLVFRRWCSGKGRRSEKTRVTSALPRCLSRSTSVSRSGECKARFTLARCSVCHLSGSRHDADHCCTRGRTYGLADGRVMTKLVAVRLIQHWVRTKFQPWVLERVARSANTSRPQSETDWRDMDAGAIVVTLVDHDGPSTVGLEHPGDASLVEIHLDEPETVYEDPMDDVDGAAHSSPRCRGVATISSTRLLPSRNQIDGRLPDEAVPVLETIAVSPRDDQQ